MSTSTPCRLPAGRGRPPDGTRPWTRPPSGASPGSLHPHRRVLGASRARPWEACPRRCWSWPHRGRQQRIGHRPRLHQHRERRSDRVSPVSAGPAGPPPRCPRPRRGSTGVSVAPSDRDTAPDALVRLVVGVARGRPGPANRAKWPETCTVASGTSRAGEDPHDADPAHVGVGGRLDYLGHQRSVGVAADRLAGPPCGVVTVGSGCSSGDGKPRTMTSSSSVIPSPLSGATGRTGWNEPRATAVSRSLIRVSRPMSSPVSQRSSRVSSSDSWMIPSIRLGPGASIAASCSGSAGRLDPLPAGDGGDLLGEQAQQPGRAPVLVAPVGRPAEPRRRRPAGRGRGTHRSRRAAGPHGSPRRLGACPPRRTPPRASG